MKNLKHLKQTLRLLFLIPALWLPGVVWAFPTPTVISGPSENLVTWYGIGGISHITILRSTNPSNFVFSVADNYSGASTGTFIDTAVTPGVEYYYVVTGNNGVLFPPTSSAAAGIPLVNDGAYAFVNSLSGLVLGSSGGATVQQSYSSPNQLWTLVSEGGGYFAIGNVVSGLALTGTTTNAQLTVSGYTGATNQLWYFQVAGGSSFNVYNLGTGQVLDDFNGSLTNGGPVGQSGIGASAGQNWTLIQIAPPQLTGVGLSSGAATTQYTFSGQVNPNGLVTTMICSLGTNASYGVSVTNVFPASVTPTNFSFTVTYPADNATLQALVTAKNARGSTTNSFTFVVGPPRIQSPGINVTSVLQANVSGQVSPNHLPTTVVMQFGTTTAYGQSLTNLLNADGGYDLSSGTFAFPNQNFGTTLHAFITASNAAGTATSGDFTFTVGPALVQPTDFSVPSVLTADVSELINPNGFPTTVVLVFVPSGGGAQVAYPVMGSNNIYQVVANEFNYSSFAGTTNLEVRIDAGNVEGNTNIYLNLPVGPPLIQSAALNVASVQQATASAQVSPNGFPTTVVVEFGTTTAYGQSVTNILGTNNVYQGVAGTFAFPTLAGTTTLHARIIASNIGGTTTSDDLTLAVGSPLIQSAALNVASVLQATAGGQVNPNGFPTTVITQFGLTPSYGQSVTNTLGSDNVYQGVANTFAFPTLSGATTLHAFITAINAGGTTTSGDLICTVGPPLMQAAAAASQGKSPQANVSAQVNPNGLPTTVVLQFGTNTAYGQTVTDTLDTSNVYLLASAAFPELSYNVGVTLHAFITASNSAGTISSGDIPFSSLLFEENSTYLDVGAVGAATWADLNNDGWLDLVVAGQYYQSGQGYVYFNPGTNQASSWLYNYHAPGGSHPAVAVGDFDNDNRPDLFYACGPYSWGLQLAVQPSFAGEPGSVTGIMYGVDTNFLNDFVPMFNSSYMAYLYVQDANVAVGDFDHTGKQDALVSGNLYDTNITTIPEAVTGPFTLLCQNNLPAGRDIVTNIPYDGRFDQGMVPVNVSIPPVSQLASYDIFSSGEALLVAGDFDNDGFLDLFALNFPIDSTMTPYAGFFHGDGNKNFTLTTNRFKVYPGTSGLGFSYIENASCVLADLNGDGYLDMVLSYVYGSTFGVGPTTNSIWLNDGHGTLTNSGIVLPQLGLANLAVGDIFNHGRNDILMVGGLDLVPNGTDIMQTVVLRNDGNGIFTPIVLGNFGSIGNTGHGLQLADYDNDGRLDFAMTGDTEPSGNGEWSGFLPGTYIFHNQMNIPSNAPPAAPPGLSTTVGNGTVTFHWSNATDDITPANLLTYNLRVGTNSLDTSVVSPIANVITGWRKLAAPGNCGHVTNTLYRFPPGTYYWSVQAVDGGFKGGAWAPEQTFTITNPEPAVLGFNQPANLQPEADDLTNPSLQYQMALMNDSSNIFNVTSNMWNVSWPTRFKGYTLEQSTNVNGPWNTNTPPIGTLNGEWSVLVTNSGGAMYFRLVK